MDQERPNNSGKSSESFKVIQIAKYSLDKNSVGTREI